MRRLVADAAVLGSSFPAEALTAVFGQDEPAVRVALAELLRREVLTVSADPLSPERGSYQFAQDMLRQVAYDTLSRRDRKSRHLAVAAHLRAAFPGDGEEVADVIARHYLDALAAVPDDPDTSQLRGQAVTTLIRAAERAGRTGAPGRAATSYATAAELLVCDEPDGQTQAGALWEGAAHAALANASYVISIEHADRAREYHLQRGHERAAARAEAIAGRALRNIGRHTEARRRLTSAIAVLRPDPDADTVAAMDELATLEVFAGSPDADRLTMEALALGQDLGVDAGRLSSLFLTRGIRLFAVGHLPEGFAYLRESARLAAQIGDYVSLGLTLLNLAEALAATDPAAAEEAARTATGHLRRVGHRSFLGSSVENLAQALLLLGDWDAAQTELTRAMDADGVTDQYLASKQGFLSALRGDVGTAETMLAELRDARDSEDPQDNALFSLLTAFIATARRQPESALRHARDAVTYASTIGMTHELVRWGWPIAVRAAYELGDSAATRELLALADSCRPGQRAPIIWAERALARARQAGRDGDHGAQVAFTVAITGLREAGIPYHLAHGLLDYAEYLTSVGDGDAAAPTVAEARDIGRRLSCPPLLERADAVDRTRPQVRV